MRGPRLIALLAAFIAPCLIPAPALATVWSEQSNIHPGTQRDDYFPRITITVDGTPWVFWMGVDAQEGDEEVLYSRWDGAGWSPPQTVNPPNNWPDRIPQVSYSPDGTLWVFWMSPRRDNQDRYVGLVSRRVANAWTSPDTVWTDATRYTNYDFHAASASEAWFVREANGGVSIYHHTGVVHDPPTSFVPVGATAYQPTIAVDSTGVVYVAWIHDFAPQLNNPLEFVIRSGGMWGTPQTIPDGPLGNSLPRITLDAANRAWIVTRAIYSSPPYTGGHIWALRWGSSGWEPMIRLSDPIGSADSLQTYTTVSRIPGQNPRAVWVRQHILRVTRYDVLTSFWDGSQWTVPELVGNLADSSYVNWPDITQRGSDTWAVWMREPVAPPYVFNIVSVHALTSPISAAVADLDAEVRGNEVLLRWNVQGIDGLAAVRIRRGEADGAALARPEAADVIGEFMGERARFGDMVDHPRTSTIAKVYWMELVLRDGTARYVGPRVASIVTPDIRTRLTGAYPNPTAGQIDLRGVVGIDRPHAIQVFSMTGRLVMELPLRQGIEIRGGTIAVAWDGHDLQGRRAASGVYFARHVSPAPQLAPTVLRFVLFR